MLKSIYRHLLPQEQTCKSIGSHWQQIGFQATDPGYDIRGAGMLGVTHLLQMAELLPETCRVVHEYSQRSKYEFPLAVKMFEFSQSGLGLLRQGKLNYACNMSGSVGDVLA